MTFAGRLVWTANDYIVQSWDSATGAITTLSSADPRLPSEVFDGSMGAMTLLGSGNLLIGFDTDPQTAFVVTPDLAPTGTVWSQPYSTHFSLSGYVGYEEASGVYDPVTGLNWCAYTVAEHAWEWNGYNDAGTFVEGRGDCELIPIFGDGYLGGRFSYPINASLLGRWLYRFGPYGDVFARYNLDTDAWEAIQPERIVSDRPPSCHLAGVDNTEGTFITIRITGQVGDTDYDGKRGWIEVRDPNADPWINPVPDGVYGVTTATMGTPLRQYDPSGPGGPATTANTYNYASGTTRVTDQGTIIYSSAPIFGTDYGYGDEDGMPWGTAVSFYEMTLSDGSIEKLCDIPFLRYNELGAPVTSVEDPYWNTNDVNGPIGLTCLEPILGFMTGAKLKDGRAFS